MSPRTFERLGIVIALVSAILIWLLDYRLPADHRRRRWIVLLLGVFIVVACITGLIGSYMNEYANAQETCKLNKKLHDLQQNAEKTLLIVAGNPEGEFAREFPLGYSVLAISGQKTFVPYESPLRGDYVVRWETAGIAGLTEAEIEVQFPDIKRASSESMVRGVTLPIKRVVGERVPAIRLDQVGLYAKVLASTQSGVLVLIGLREVQSQ